MEFNEKYNKWLRQGYYGLAINNEKVTNYLDKEFELFIKIPGFYYSQIKTKFGWPRFYAEGISGVDIRRVEETIYDILNEKS